MCCSCCLVKSCCCGAELGNGVLFWAIADAIVHLLLLAVPSQMSDVAPFSTYFVAWIGFLIFTDIVLAFACKVSIANFS